jgi:hypothetical protein
MTDLSENLKTPTRTWTRVVDNTTYTCSTDTALIQLDALNSAFSSDLLWWAKPLSAKDLYKTVHNSLCFGVYVGGDEFSSLGMFCTHTMTVRWDTKWRQRNQ